MKEIIAPVSKEVLKQELTKEFLVRPTNNGENELYILTHHDAPNVMREIGRLRELTFREAGGGTGKDCDIDHYDTSDKHPYKQMFVWDPIAEEIVGGYRFFLCSKDIIPVIEEYLATGRAFHFSDDFKTNYLPYTIELGRSFIQPQYQSTKIHSKAIYALDNLWDGLGTLIVDNPQMKYFFGKVTMYKKYNSDARNLLLYFMKKHFNDSENLVVPRNPFIPEADKEKISAVFLGEDYTQDYKILSKEVKNLGEFIPPLINTYMNISATMKFFGTMINTYFGGVEESGIMITMEDIYPRKTERHITSYISIKDEVV